MGPWGRRGANGPLQTVAIRLWISPSRISKIQQAIEAVRITPQQTRAFAKCNVRVKGVGSRFLTSTSPSRMKSACPAAHVLPLEPSPIMS